LSGGLGDLLKQFQEKGQGDAANSWVSNGPNKQIAPGDLASALGVDQINSLAAQSGMSSDELLKGLSQYLPDVINHLTPDGGCRTRTKCRAGFDVAIPRRVWRRVACHLDFGYWDIEKGRQP